MGSIDIIRQQKKQLLSALGGIGLSAVIISCVYIFGFGMWGIYALLMSFNLGMSLYSKSFKWKSYLITGITLLALLLLFFFVSSHTGGVLGFILTSILAAVVILYYKWDLYIEYKEEIERKLFGMSGREMIEEKRKLRESKESK